MIKIATKSLSKNKPFRIIVHIFLFLLLYIFLPFYLSLQLYILPKLLVTFYLINTLSIFYLFKKNLNKKYFLEYQIQGFEEKLNILNNENLNERQNNVALQAKINRYNGLKKVVEELSESSNLDSLSDSLTTIAFSLIANNKGVCLLYLVDMELQKLSLLKARKEDKELVIKTKQGDTFDFWVLRHGSPLLIDDIKKDFRFDLEKIKTEEKRPFSSLVSSPLISDHKFLGILRLDNPKVNFYSQDDLRLLVAICDLGAVALENSQLFQQTNDLAIHDGLTSLFSKGYFLERLRQECQRSFKNMVFSLLMLDIDYFKNYNDKFGHTAGDIVLKKLSEILIDFFKDANPIISRFGGEEFCIVLPAIDRKKAYTFACNLRQKIEEEKIILRKKETNVTVSIGVAVFPADGAKASELIMQADKAMYEAKLKGRNQVCCI